MTGRTSQSGISGVSFSITSLKVGCEVECGASKDRALGGCSEDSAVHGRREKVFVDEHSYVYGLGDDRSHAARVVLQD